VACGLTILRCDGSLDWADGCSEVQQSVSETYNLDTNGYWSTSIRYNPLNVSSTART
jgi:hypothetical protein